MEPLPSKWNVPFGFPQEEHYETGTNKVIRKTSNNPFDDDSYLEQSYGVSAEDLQRAQEELTRQMHVRRSRSLSLSIRFPSFFLKRG